MHHRKRFFCVMIFEGHPADTVATNIYKKQPSLAARLFFGDKSK